MLQISHILSKSFIHGCIDWYICNIVVKKGLNDISSDEKRNGVKYFYLRGSNRKTLK